VHSDRSQTRSGIAGAVYGIRLDRGVARFGIFEDAARVSNVGEPVFHTGL
jgi:hypothetical protein